MMILPNPGVLDHLIRERQEKLRTTHEQAQARRRRAGMRVRIGRALIAAGSTLSGERVERPARPSTHPRPA
jgi:hypothetical protein